METCKLKYNTFTWLNIDVWFTETLKMYLPIYIPPTYTYMTLVFVYYEFYIWVTNTCYQLHI